MILERRHLVARFCPGLTRSAVEGSLYGLLTKKYGLPIQASDQMIQAVNLSPADARRLGVFPGAAALRLRAIGHAGAPLWLEDTLYRGDRYEFHNSIGDDKRPRPASLVILGRSPGQKKAPCQTSHPWRPK